MEIVEEIEIACPQCGEGFTIEVDTTIPRQEFIEDCAVCCRPMTIAATCEPGVVANLQIEAA